MKLFIREFDSDARGCRFESSSDHPLNNYICSPSSVWVPSGIKLKGSQMRGLSLGPIFHMLLSKMCKALTPTVPIVARLWDTFIFTYILL